MILQPKPPTGGFKHKIYRIIILVSRGIISGANRESIPEYLTGPRLAAMVLQCS